MSFDLSTLKNAENNVLTSLNAQTTKEKKALFNAMNVSDDALGDHVGETIVIKDYIAHNVKIENEDAVRIVLIDVDGKSYSSVSTGLVQAITKIFAIFGQPDEWDEPMAVKVLEKKSSKDSKNKFLTLELV